MPLYEYECLQCQRHTEKRQKFSDVEITECPHCGGKLQRVITAPAIAFKGGGWYADGYGNAKPKSSADGAPAADGKPAGEAKSSDGKSEAAPANGSSDSGVSKGESSGTAKPSPAPATAPSAPAPANTSTAAPPKN